MIKQLFFVLSVLIPTTSFGLTFTIKEDNDIVGIVQDATVQAGESLYDIARRFDVGLFELMEANPHIKSKKPSKGTELTIPTSFIMPATRSGMVLNLAELRIYFFHPDGKKVSTFPVGIGRKGWLTPVGETIIQWKQAKPDWNPPKSIRQHYLKKGVTLPDKIPPGPKNPLGEFALYLGWQNYLIHGTNQPTSVGLRSSSGCIRMYPEDIRRLYYLVKPKTKVTVIHAPYKVGKRDGDVYIEAHEPLPEPYYGEENDRKLLEHAVQAKLKQHWFINMDAASEEMKQTFGYPVKVN